MARSWVFAPLHNYLSHMRERKNSFIMIMIMIVAQLTVQKRAHIFYLKWWRHKTLIQTRQSLTFNYSKVSTWNSVFKKPTTFLDFPKSQLSAHIPRFQQTIIIPSKLTDWPFYQMIIWILMEVSSSRSSVIKKNVLFIRIWCS